jgi:hypothetical protein
MTAYGGDSCVASWMGKSRILLELYVSYRSVASRLVLLTIRALLQSLVKKAGLELAKGEPENRVLRDLTHWQG